jgi:hypothetical protein
MRVPTIPHIPTYARKFIVMILAKGMTDIAGDAPQLFIFTSIRDLDGDMWDDAGTLVGTGPPAPARKGL